MMQYDIIIVILMIFGKLLSIQHTHIYIYNICIIVYIVQIKSFWLFSLPLLSLSVSSNRNIDFDSLFRIEFSHFQWCAVKVVVRYFSIIIIIIMISIVIQYTTIVAGSIFIYIAILYMYI